MSVIESIINEFEVHKGEFVITMSNKIEQFVGLGTDNEDYYYITYDGVKLTWNTCVGKLIYLKNQLCHEDYHRFISKANLNFKNKVLIGDALINHTTELCKVNGDDELITELYFIIR